jgi:ATP-binding cassette subfamily F protein uup
METLDLLQELIAGFPGTVLLVSHDRDFLDRTVTSTIVPEGDGRWTEYAGGYGDMLAQRGVARLDQAPGTKRKAPADAPRAEQRPQQSTRKLSYKQKFALETLPGKIEAAGAEIARLEAAMADPELFRRDPAAFQKTSARLTELAGQVAAMEEEWMELEMLREEIES